MTGIVKLMESMLKHHRFEKGDVKFFMSIKRKAKHINDFEKEAEDDDLKPHVVNACEIPHALILFEETLKETISDTDANEKEMEMMTENHKDVIRMVKIKWKKFEGVRRHRTNRG